MATLGRKRKFEEVQDDSKSQETKPSAETAKAPQGPTFSKQLLQIYYDRLFPYQPFFNWLSYFNDPENSNPAIIRKFWCNREFSFTLKDDIYIRYKSYKNLSEWKVDLKKKCPYKIDIGALYNIEPCRRGTVSQDRFIAEEKELVFDVDITDYDDVRSCCSEAGICTKCWPLMCCAIEVMEAALREDFGLKHLLWVFSGRRGIHCWVGDDVTRTLDVAGRSALIEYLKLYEGNSMNKFKVDMHIERTGYDIHSSLTRAFGICLKYFIKCSLEIQGVLDSVEGITYFTDQIRFPEIQREVHQQLLAMVDSDDCEAKWKVVEDVFKKYIEMVAKSGGSKGASFQDKRLGKKAIEANKMELVFSYVYPRLDVEVSRHVNHLLKSPFCVHPKTGKVCTIIDPKTCHEFDPHGQPTLVSLIDEYNEAGKANKDGKSTIGWKNTSMNEVMETFRRTFLDGLQKERIAIYKRAQKELDSNMTF